MKTIHKTAILLTIITLISALSVIFSSQLTALLYYLIIDQNSMEFLTSGLLLLGCFFVGVGMILFALVDDIFRGWVGANEN